MVKLIKDIRCMFLKELWQISSNKKLIVTCLCASLFPLICAFKCENSILPMEFFRKIFPVCVAYLTCNSVMQTIIIEEINNNTLDILMTSRLSKLSIIIGKASLGTVFGVINTFISLGLLYIASFFSPYLEGYQFISMYTIVASIEVALIGALISIILALILKTIQLMTMANMLVILGLMFLAYYLIFNLSLPMYMLGISIAVGCILLTWLSVKFIGIRNYTIK